MAYSLPNSWLTGQNVWKRGGAPGCWGMSEVPDEAFEQNPHVEPKRVNLEDARGLGQPIYDEPVYEEEPAEEPPGKDVAEMFLFSEPPPNPPHQDEPPCQNALDYPLFSEPSNPLPMTQEDNTPESPEKHKEVDSPTESCASHQPISETAHPSTPPRSVFIPVDYVLSEHLVDSSRHPSGSEDWFLVDGVMQVLEINTPGSLAVDIVKALGLGISRSFLADVRHVFKTEPEVLARLLLICAGVARQCDPGLETVEDLRNWISQTKRSGGLATETYAELVYSAVKKGMSGTWEAALMFCDTGNTVFLSAGDTFFRDADPHTYELIRQLAEIAQAKLPD